MSANHLILWTDNIMDKILLEVVTITSSVSHNNSFVVVLKEREGGRQLPIVIGGTEAQSIVVAIENMRPSRPLTHDLMKSTMDSFDIQLQKVVINRFLEGVFYSELYCERNGVSEQIDSRTSDAIAMALRFGAPIYTYQAIMDEASVELELIEEDENLEDFDEDPLATFIDTQTEEDVTFSKVSIEDLNKMLQEALDKEEYEQAAKIRDEIDHRKL